MTLTLIVQNPSVTPMRPVLFIEVDGLYVKRQKKRIKGREEKIAADHEGWLVNGQRRGLPFVLTILKTCFLPRIVFTSCP